MRSFHFQRRAVATHAITVVGFGHRRQADLLVTYLTTWQIVYATPPIYGALSHRCCSPSPTASYFNSLIAWFVNPSLHLFGLETAHARWLSAILFRGPVFCSSFIKVGPRSGRDSSLEHLKWGLLWRHSSVCWHSPRGIDQLATSKRSWACKNYHRVIILKARLIYFLDKGQTFGRIFFPWAPWLLFSELANFCWCLCFLLRECPRSRLVTIFPILPNPPARIYLPSRS